MESNRSNRSPVNICSPCAARDRFGSAIPMCAACDVRGLTFCAVLSDDELACIQAIVRQLRFASGQMLFQEGDDADTVFNVVYGIIKLYKLLPDGRRQITGFLIPGDFLGIAARGTYSHSAEAVADVTVCRFPRRQLYSLFDRFPKLERQLLGIATDELTAAQDQMLLLGRKTASEKLSSFLLALAYRSDVTGDASDPVHVPMTRVDVADYLGLTVETVSRTFGRLKNAGLIEVPDAYRVVLVRRAELEEIAEGF